MNLFWVRGTCNTWTSSVLSSLFLWIHSLSHGRAYLQGSSYIMFCRCPGWVSCHFSTARSRAERKLWRHLWVGIRLDSRAGYSMLPGKDLSLSATTIKARSRIRSAVFLNLKAPTKDAKSVASQQARDETKEEPGGGSSWMQNRGKNECI